MAIPLEIPPLLDVVLTLSAMLGLFAYVYWLSSADDRRTRGLSESKPMNGEGTVMPVSAVLARKPSRQHQLRPMGFRWISGNIKLYEAAKRKR
jgi:hypothetical protein